MEVGAVKQAFNNELILLKKNLNQAKLHVIHKLTRKAKTLTEKKAPEQLKEKLKRKAESAVKEVLIIKKIKARDIGKFIVTHTGKLQDYLNKPQVDHDKACARLLLHKVMQDKYKIIRGRFTNVPIKDLFMSRQERLKLKKEARDKQKEKNRNKKKKNQAVNAEGDWDVEEVDMADDSKEIEDENDVSGDENGSIGNESGHSKLDDELEQDSKSGSSKADEDSDHEDESDGNEDEETDVKKIVKPSQIKIDKSSVKSTIALKSKPVSAPKVKEESDNEDGSDENEDEKTDVKKIVKPSYIRLEKSSVKGNKTLKSKQAQAPKDKIIESKFKIIEKEIRKKQEKKPKDNKNKNFNEKILQRKFKKESNDTAIVENKVVDPFFITSTGENYMSVAEPRPPDEIKEIHKEGNRQMRRAAMFGHVPKIKPRYDNFNQENSRFNKPQSFDRQHNRLEKQNGINNRFNNNFENDNARSNFNDRHNNPKMKNEEESKPEKLHPSWEAKKRQSGILPFKGKKIVFDEG